METKRISDKQKGKNTPADKALSSWGGPDGIRVTKLVRFGTL